MRNEKPSAPLLAMAAILFAAGLTVWSGPAWSQAQCSTANGMKTCTVPAGTAAPVSINNSDNFNNTLVIQNSGSYQYSLGSTSQNPAALFGATQGTAGGTSASAGTTSGNVQQLTLSNTAGISVSLGQYWANNAISAVLAQSNVSVGGNASDSKHDAGAGGNVLGTPSLTNSGVISLSGNNTAYSGGAALLATSKGGDAGSVVVDKIDGNGNPSFKGGLSATGGQGAGASVVNSGGVTVSLSGAKGFSGIAATGYGGNSGSATAGVQAGGSTGAYGGGGGTVAVTNSAPVSLTWNWTATSASDTGAFGILAQSMGGNGSSSYTSKSNGGAGGAAQGGTIVLSKGGDVTLASGTGYTSSTGNVASAGIAVRLLGAAGGAGYDSSAGGLGGDGGAYNSGTMSIAVTDASVRVSGGDTMPAILAQALGGNGGTGGIGQDHSNGGGGGNSTNAIVTVSASTIPVAVSSTGATSPGIAAITQAGSGGAGTDYTCPFICAGVAGGQGAAGGNASSASVTLNGNVSVTTQGNQSPGLVVSATGGNGGKGGDLNGDINVGNSGVGGAGGAAGSVAVTLNSGASIETQGSSAPGVSASSVAGNGGAGGYLSEVSGDAPAGGAGGSSSTVVVTLASGASIATTGSDSNGILAQSRSGAGGMGGQEDVLLGGSGGAGGAGGATGAVTVTSGGTITTQGTSARGIVAQGLSGAGGAGNVSNGIFYAGGGNGGSSGSVGAVAVTNTGSITTAGQGAQGILVQSIAGGGGAAGKADGTVVSIGGTGGSNPVVANSGSVLVNGSGSVTTTGSSAIAILAQSVGGGGGDGGGTTGAIGIGGSGAGGGAGGSATATLGAVTLRTGGDLSDGVVLQSIGGGGGNGGNAKGVGVGFSLDIGGTGAGGGAGGTVSFSTAAGSNIVTAGTKSAGVVAQSIGGGGGTGGSAYATSVSPGISASVAVGGSGSAGGTAGQVSGSLVGGSIATGQTTALTSGTGTATNLLPVDTYGAVFQSIGGGGGNGGSATANAVAISVPVTPNVQVAVAASASVGGKGGAGGSGGAVAIGLQSGESIITAGQGGHGLVAQSIGGGGGIGGDSSSLSVALGYGRAAGQLDGVTAISLTPTFSLGGSGGIAGSGSSIGVGVALGGTATVSGTSLALAQVSTGLASSIATYGDFADGILAQSVGGGGGNAGFGSGNTQSYGAGMNLTASVTLGSSGGAGGSGGPVTVNLYAGNSITTYGSGAIGVVAQSIAGGGGASQGGSYTLGISPSSSLRGIVNLALGGTGASGGTASAVNVMVGGPISTAGGGAYGVLAQSIGGGGGLGGSPGADASADNPVLQVAKVREFVTNLTGSGAPTDYTFSVALGGAGGSAGNGGTVTVATTANITTKGDWASGIVAQSVGGGGGVGGTAVASGTGGIPEVTLNLGGARGGNAGPGGSGDAVAVSLGSSTISTNGFAASGVLAQSVGGGGGLAGDGSDQATGIVSVGGSTGGNGGAGGTGGAVSLAASGSAITTRGEQAHGVLLQSVGGSGGIAGTGSSVTVGVVSQSVSSTAMGGTNSGVSNSAGGNVTFNTAAGSSTANTAVLTVTTAGANAYGILAQSVGAGGGIASGPQSSSGTTAIGGQSTHDSNSGGGVVTVGLSTGSRISTSGTGAHGIFAQSIGGGGGIAGYPGTAPVASISQPKNSFASQGGGGSVSVTTASPIVTTGAGAFGILAQSVGAGGGMRAVGNTLYLGSSGGSGSSGSGGLVTVTATGGISATGSNSDAVFAQSTGANGAGLPIHITLGGSVTGGSGSGWGVQVDGGQSGNDNSLTINAGGSLWATSNNTISATGSALLVNNYGAITGNTYLNGGTLNNLGGGTTNTAAVVQGSIVNTGLVALGGRMAGPAFGGSAFTTTTVTGSYSQGPGGVLRAGVDFNTRQADTLVVQGPTLLGGSIGVLAGNVLPQVRVPVVVAIGGVSGTVTGSASTLYAYDTQVSGSTVSVTARSTGFNLPGLGVAGAGAEVAQHLTSVFNTATTPVASPALGTLFGTLGQLADAGGGGYAAALSQLSPGTMLAFASRRLAETSDFADQLMSCPSFQGADALLTETGCAWARTTYRSVQQSSGGGYAGFGLDTTSFRLGGQAAFAPGWFAGAAVGYDQSWLKGSDNAKGNGGAGFLGVSLKREWGGWQFAAALFGSLSDNNTTRVVSVPNFQSVLRGSPGVDSQGLRLLAAYTQAYDMVYVRPSLSLDIVRVHAGAFQENGQSTVGLAMQDTDQVSAVGTALVELGTRSSLWGGELRRYVRLGVSVPSNTRFSQPARLVGAASSADWFAATTPMSGTSARLGLGVQFVTAGNIDLRLAYDGAYSDRVTSHAGTLTGALRF